MNFTLSNGLAMPVVGIGTFTMTPAQAETAVLCALTSGYRMIDTAQAYMNERAVGRAIRKSGVARGEIFLCTISRNGRCTLKRLDCPTNVIR
jgi:diketogulonate reductase-like aldo/keto reductase